MTEPEVPDPEMPDSELYDTGGELDTAHDAVSTDGPHLSTLAESRAGAAGDSATDTTDGDLPPIPTTDRD